MTRMLAHVEEVVRVFPIDGADKIEAVQVLGWECVIKKGDLKQGDKCVYIEIDSIVPQIPMFQFLADRKFRIKTIKLRKQVSQGLALPINEELLQVLGVSADSLNIGDDLTDKLGVIKYLSKSEREADEVDDIPIPKTGMGRTASWFYGHFRIFRWVYNRLFPRPHRGFPDWIPKTDETRVQANPNYYLGCKEPMYSSEKLDGQSSTYAFWWQKNWFRDRPEFVMCSRNRRVGVITKGSWPRIAEIENVEMKLRSALDDNFEFDAVAIQGEIIGPGIQKNRYRREDYELYVFNVLFKQKDGKVVFLSHDNMKFFCEKYGFRMVPVLDNNFKIPSTLEEILKYADGKSVICPKNTSPDREGVVVRSHNQEVSFKVISNKFLLKTSDEPESDE